MGIVICLLDAPCFFSDVSDDETDVTCGDAGSHMCCPVLYPQMTGGAAPPGLVTLSLSTVQSPTVIDSGTAVPANPEPESPENILSTCQHNKVDSTE